MDLGTFIFIALSAIEHRKQSQFKRKKQLKSHLILR